MLNNYVKTMDQRRRLKNGRVSLKISHEKVLRWKCAMEKLDKTMS